MMDMKPQVSFPRSTRKPSVAPNSRWWANVSYPRLRGSSVYSGTRRTRTGWIIPPPFEEAAQNPLVILLPTQQRHNPCNWTPCQRLEASDSTWSAFDAVASTRDPSVVDEKRTVIPLCTNRSRTRGGFIVDSSAPQSIHDSSHATTLSLPQVPYIKERIMFFSRYPPPLLLLLASSLVPVALNRSTEAHHRPQNSSSFWLPLA